MEKTFLRLIRMLIELFFKSYVVNKSLINFYSSIVRILIDRQNCNINCIVGIITYYLGISKAYLYASAKDYFFS